MPGMRQKFKQVAARLGPALPRQEKPDLFWDHYANTADGVKTIAIPVRIFKNDKTVFDAEFHTLSSPRSLTFLAAAKVLEAFGRKHPGTDWDKISIGTLTVGRERALKAIYENEIVRASGGVKPGVFETILKLRDDLLAIKTAKPGDVRMAFEQAKNNFAAGVALSAYEVKVKRFSFFDRLMRRDPA